MDREVKVDPLRQHILEGVECLRLRKCRPDRESIAHHVLRKFGSTMNEIFAELENIVDEGGLIKVEYKGTTSYRNPQSFDTKNSPLLTKHSKILNSSKTTRFIISGINELLVKDPNYAQAGVPLEELKKKLMEFDSTRFTDETINSLVEREMNCGGIHIAKSDYLTQPLRVFPKDIPMPSDMHNVISLGEDNSVEIEEEIKPKKVRKGTLEPNSSPEGRKSKKSKTAVESPDVTEEFVQGEEDDATEKVEDLNPPKKRVMIYANARLSTVGVGRKIVAERVAEAVRKSYESTAEFETTSAQMIKLAEAVVSKQSEPVIEPLTKGPSLVLASSMIQSNDDPKDSTEYKPEPDDIPLNGIAKKSDEQPQDSATIVVAKKGRGRVTIKHERSLTPEKPMEEVLGLESEAFKKEFPSPTEPGLTRSKRDKRKKQVFDPSDPNTYSGSSVKKARLSDKLLTPKSSTANTKGRKSVPGTVDTKLQNSNNVNKSNLRRKPEAAQSSSRNNSNSPQSSNVHGSDIDESVASTLESPTFKKEAVIMYCSYCQDSKKEALEKAEEEFLTCSTCDSNIHPSCINYSLELCGRIKKFAGSRGIKWQCYECKTCPICSAKIPPTSIGSSDAVNSKNVDDASSVLLCEQCNVAFHAKCTVEGEGNTKSSTDTWICPGCQENKKEETKKTGKNVRTPKKKTSVPKNLKKELSPDSDQTNGNQPEVNAFPDDLRLWSEEDVENYFSVHGLKEEAANLRSQALDGYGLLLLQREDIVNSMGFRLGPALKVYRLVHELQQKAPVQPHSSWTETESEKVE